MFCTAGTVSYKEDVKLSFPAGVGHPVHIRGLRSAGRTLSFPTRIERRGRWTSRLQANKMLKVEVIGKKKKAVHRHHPGLVRSHKKRTEQWKRSMIIPENILSGNRVRS